MLVRLTESLRRAFSDELEEGVLSLRSIGPLLPSPCNPPLERLLIFIAMAHLESDF